LRAEAFANNLLSWTQTSIHSYDGLRFQNPTSLRSLSEKRRCSLKVYHTSQIRTGYNLLSRRKLCPNHLIPQRNALWKPIPTPGSAITGQVAYHRPEHPDCWLSFGYRVIRVWEQNPETLLNGPLALLPLTPIANVSADALPAIVRRMETRIDSDVPRESRGLLWTTTFLLMGLRYEGELIARLLEGVREMKESTTYQYIIEPVHFRRGTC
jgi:hypothetical protein